MWNPVKPAEPAKPWLATGAQWSQDYKSVKVTVRDNVTWSDGQKLTADDVAFTYQLLKDNDQVNTYGIPFDTVTTSGNTVTLTFKSPQFVNQVKILSWQAIVPKHLWESVKDPSSFLNKTPVGTGAYTLKSFTPQTTTLTVRPSGYWGQVPKVKELRYTSFTDNNAQSTALGNGSSEWSFVFIPNYKTVYVAKDPTHNHVWAPPVLGIHGLYLNITKKPLDNVALRQAMNLAINRQDIFNQAEAGYFHPLVTNVTGIPSTGESFIAPEYKDKNQAVDIPAAKKLLTDAGFTYSGTALKDPSGKPVNITLTDPAPWSDYQTSLEIVKDNLSQIGVQATVDKANQDSWTKNMETGNFDAAFRWTNGGATPYDLYQTIMDGDLLKPIGTHSPQGNFGRFKSPEATAALKAYANATDDAARTQAMNTVQKIFVEEMPMIPVGADNVGAAYSTKNWDGWPNDADPYAGSQPTQPYAAAVVQHLTPANGS